MRRTASIAVAFLAFPLSWLPGAASGLPSLPQVFSRTSVSPQLGKRIAEARAARNARPATSCGGELNVGFRVQTFASGLRGGVWYPSTGAETTYNYPGNYETAVAVSGPVAPCEKYPLVVFSHGYGGCSIQSVYFTEALARAGYIVAAPDHRDSLCKVDQGMRLQMPDAEVPGAQKEYTDAMYRYRQQDIRAVLDEMTHDRDFGPRIDVNRIAGAGHSLGGYTIAGMAGAWPSWKDGRIKAGLLLAAWIQPFVKTGGMKSVHVPLMFEGGTRDPNSTPAVRAAGGAYDQSNRPKYFVDFSGAGHLDFSNLGCKMRKYVSACAADVEVPRLVNSYGIAFLDHYLKGTAEPILTRPNPGLAEFRYTP